MAYADVLSSEMQSQIEGGLRGAFSPRGYELMQSGAVAGKLAAARTPPRCISGPCLRDVGKALGVRLVLVGGVSGEGTTFDLSLTVLETREGKTVAQGADRCDVCTFTEVQSTMQKLAERVAEQLATTAPPQAPEVVAAEAAAGPEPERARPEIWKGWKWVGLGVGVVGLGVGLALLSMDNECADDACQEKYATGTAGISFAIIGSAALGGSGLLWLFGY